MSDVLDNAKSTVLDAVRSALGERSGDRAVEYARIPRDYDAAPTLDRTEVIELFEDRLRDYDCTTHRCASSDLPNAIARCLQAGGRSKMVISDDFPAARLPDGFSFVRDRELSYDEIDNAGGVLTLCSVAIALTGTIILQESAVGQGRRVLSLLPDYHLCVVDASRIVQTLPEGLQAIEATAGLATTTISGPSATADIEMTRIRGVHGPRVLEVIVHMGESIRTAFETSA